VSGQLAITLIHSPNGAPPKVRATVEALGLRKLHQTVVLPDNPSTRGAALKVRHLIAVEALDVAAEA
jgi:large subunit ribosomal protein L30